jgi:hypothetical protein
MQHAWASATSRQITVAIVALQERSLKGRLKQQVPGELTWRHAQRDAFGFPDAAVAAAGVAGR